MDSCFNISPHYCCAVAHRETCLQPMTHNTNLWNAWVFIIDALVLYAGVKVQGP